MILELIVLALIRTLLTQEIKVPSQLYWPDTILAVVTGTDGTVVGINISDTGTDGTSSLVKLESTNTRILQHFDFLLGLWLFIQFEIRPMAYQLKICIHKSSCTCKLKSKILMCTLLRWLSVSCRWQCGGRSSYFDQSHAAIPSLQLLLLLQSRDTFGPQVQFKVDSAP